MRCLVPAADLTLCIRLLLMHTEAKDTAARLVVEWIIGPQPFTMRHSILILASPYWHEQRPLTAEPAGPVLHVE